MFQAIQNNSVSFSKSIVATDLEGNQVEIANCYTSLYLGDGTQSISISINFQKPTIIQTNRAEIQAQVSSFVDEVNKAAVSNNFITLVPTPVPAK